MYFKIRVGQGGEQTKKTLCLKPTILRFGKTTLEPKKSLATPVYNQINRNKIIINSQTHYDNQ